MNTDAPSRTDSRGPGRITAALTRWTLIVHAALIAAQPFLAGAMLDAMSANAQLWHRNTAMAIVTVGLVQLVLTLVAWRGKAHWPADAFWVSLAMWILELLQYTLGHQFISMSLHIPLGAALLVVSVFLALRYARRS